MASAVQWRMRKKDEYRHDSLMARMSGKTFREHIDYAKLRQHLERTVCDAVDEGYFFNADTYFLGKRKSCTMH